jgi:hypothetical protein
MSYSLFTNDAATNAELIKVLAKGDLAEASGLSAVSQRKKWQINNPELCASYSRKNYQNNEKARKDKSLRAAYKRHLEGKVVCKRLCDELIAHGYDDVVYNGYQIN